MCLPSKPKPPPPPPAPPAPPVIAPPPPPPPAPEVNAAETKLRQNAPQTPRTKTTASSKTYSKKRGKSALRIPLQIGGGSNQSGANVPSP